MKSACAITRKLKVARYIAIVRLIFYSMKKNAPCKNSLCLRAQVLRLSVIFREFSKLLQIIGAI